MAKALDQEKLDSADLKILDINNPPVKDIPYQAYPKMLYLHPKDKTQEHRHMVVQNSADHDAAEAKGWKPKPHIPVEVEEDLSDEFEAEAPETSDPLDSMTKPELVAYAKENNIEIDATEKKDVIRAAIKASEAA